MADTLLFMKPLKLKNKIQKYSWGTRHFIPDLLGINETGEHFAELWMGDHPRGPSSAILGNREIPLNELINSYPDDLLGKDIIKFGNKIPFLFKVLSAMSPLSIQAHPNKIQAEAGYRDENNRGVPLDAFNRNYKDSNHKPEIICALTPFTAMCGFCDSKLIESNFLKLKSSVFKEKLQGLFEGDEEIQIKQFFSTLMSLPDKDLTSLIDSALIWAGNNSSIEGALIKKFSVLYKIDQGILAPLFLNIYSLKPGEALYQGPGELHAYVEGTGIELMANSDNVLRGGLTPKHVDVDELIKVLNFKPSGKNILKPVKIKLGVFEYITPSNEFSLGYLQVEKNKLLEINNNKSIGILLCISGNAVLNFSGGSFDITKGDSLLIPASLGSYTLDGSAEIFSAGIPGSGK